MTAIAPDKTVGQLVAERPGRARVFERFGIDYCCGGKTPPSAGASAGRWGSRPARGRGLDTSCAGSVAACLGGQGDQGGQVLEFSLATLKLRSAFLGWKSKVRRVPNFDTHHLGMLVIG